MLLSGEGDPALCGLVEPARGLVRPDEDLALLTPHMIHLGVLGQFSYVQMRHVHLPEAMATTALLRSLLAAFAASGELGEVRGEFLRDPAIAPPSVLMLMLKGWMLSVAPTEGGGVITDTALGRTVRHCVQRVARGQLR
jgi:hypothetical protein